MSGKPNEVEKRLGELERSHRSTTRLISALHNTINNMDETIKKENKYRRLLAGDVELMFDSSTKTVSEISSKYCQLRVSDVMTRRSIADLKPIVSSINNKMKALESGVKEHSKEYSEAISIVNANKQLCQSNYEDLQQVKSEIQLVIKKLSELESKITLDSRSHDHVTGNEGKTSDPSLYKKQTSDLVSQNDDIPNKINDNSSSDATISKKENHALVESIIGSCLETGHSTDELKKQQFPLKKVSKMEQESFDEVVCHVVKIYNALPKPLSVSMDVIERRNQFMRRSVVLKHVARSDYTILVIAVGDKMWNAIKLQKGIYWDEYLLKCIHYNRHECNKFTYDGKGLERKGCINCWNLYRKGVGINYRHNPDSEKCEAMKAFIGLFVAGLDTNFLIRQKMAVSGASKSKTAAYSDLSKTFINFKSDHCLRSIEQQPREATMTEMVEKDRREASYRDNISGGKKAK